MDLNAFGFGEHSLPEFFNRWCGIHRKAQIPRAFRPVELYTGVCKRVTHVNEQISKWEQLFFFYIENSFVSYLNSTSSCSWPRVVDH